jgi:thymidylate synthase ThyX
MKTQIKAEIVAHSVNEQGDELISVLATFPRIILAEVNTHRMLSKNTSSSRAIPFNKMVETVQNDPFIPIAWQKEHKGMQGTEYLVDRAIDLRKQQWLIARDNAVEMATSLSLPLNDFGGDLVSEPTTKQLANRLLEPFMWTTMLITGPKSGWNNFFNLRCPQYYSSIGEQNFYDKSWKDYLNNAKNRGFDSNLIESARDANILMRLKSNKGQAEIHMMALAECIWDAYNESTPKVLEAGDWHIPFENKIDIVNYIPDMDYSWIPQNSQEDEPGHWVIEGGEEAFYEACYKAKVKISVAMAARTSYTVVGEEKKIDYEAMIGLHDRLLAQDPPHSSPLEHCARAMSEVEYTAACSTGLSRKGFDGKDMYGWCNNLKGFIPYRYMVDNDYEK